MLLFSTLLIPQNPSRFCKMQNFVAAIPSTNPLQNHTKKIKKKKKMSAMKLQHRAKTAYEEGSYLLDGACSPNVIAASNSLQTVKLYSTDSLEFVGELKGHTDHIKDIVFNKADPNALMTFGDSGSVNLWDVRSMKHTSLPLPLGQYSVRASGDLSCDGTYLAVGDGVDITIYDSRNMGQSVYNLKEFHSDDITKVRFHPTQANIVCTGSEDGLLIASDATAANEDDAILWIFNTENAVNQISYNDSKVVAITSMDSVCVGCLDTGDTMGIFERPTEYLYAIGAIEGMMMWGVNGEGYESRAGEIRCAQIGVAENIDGWPVMTGGHEDVVRFALTLPSNPHVVFTGGEDGFITKWGHQGREGLPSESRKTVKDVEVSEDEIPSGAPPMDTEDVISAGIGAVKVSSLATHKGRKASSKARSGPY